jgi:hypothetical protein
MDQTALLTMFSVLMFQIGSRQITFDVTKAQKKIFQHPFTHFVVVLCMFYIGTRRWPWALTLVFVYYLSMRVLLNESNPYNLFSKKWLRDNGFIPEHLESMDKVKMYYDNIRKLPM